MKKNKNLVFHSPFPKQVFKTIWFQIIHLENRASCIEKNPGLSVRISKRFATSIQFMTQGQTFNFFCASFFNQENEHNLFSSFQ